MKNLTIGAISLAVGLSAFGEAQAQQNTGWATIVDGLAVFQSDSDLSGGGGFSANRQFLRAGALYRSDQGASFGLFASIGQLSYDFDTIGAAPWGDVQDIQLSAPVRFAVGDRAKVLISPTLRWDYETDASASDGLTYGVFAGISWQVSQGLEIGPAFGAFSELGTSELELFPALLVNWDMAPRWNLKTGSGLGATRGPGVTLSYQASDAMRISLIARSEKSRFQLDNKGLAPGGVGEDSSIPVVVSVDFRPNPGVSFSAFAGAEFDGRLKLENGAGNVVSSQTYDMAPIVGVSLRVIF